MSELQHDEVEKILHKILNVMEQKQMLPPVINKQHIVKNVLDTFKNNGIKLDSNDFDFNRNPEQARAMTKSLMVALSTESVALHQLAHPDPNYKPEHKFKYENLFKPQPDNYNKDELSNQFKQMFKMLNKPQPGGKKFTEKELDILAEKLAEGLGKNYLKTKDTNQLGKTDQVADALSEFTLSLASLYGGVSPDGKIVGPPQTILGNFTGQLDQSAGGALTFMSEQNTGDLNKISNTGGAIMLTNMVSRGGFMAEVEQALKNDHLLAPDPSPATSRMQNPFQTKPMP